jgi:hypothetical protein
MNDLPALENDRRHTSQDMRSQQKDNSQLRSEDSGSLDRV